MIKFVICLRQVGRFQFPPPIKLTAIILYKIELSTHNLNLSGVRVARSLVFCVVFCDCFLSFFSFGHCVVCPSSIYEFYLPH
jgi:hypothetical protein